MLRISRTAFGIVALAAAFAPGQPVPQSQPPLAPPDHGPKPPALGRPTGTVVRVRTEPELQFAVQRLRSNTTIVLEPGTYQLSRSLQIGGGVRDVVIRGATDDRRQVVLKGAGMSRKEYGLVPHGIMVNDATDVTIANLSVGDVWHHPVTLQGQLGCKHVRLFNVRLFDAGEQFLKGNPDGRGGGADGLAVEYCLFEFTDTARHDYTQGMSVHGAADWVVRYNLFRNIRGPAHAPNVGGCIDFWNGSKSATVEGNVIVNCRLGIRFGLTNKKVAGGVHDHEGGVIRNNVVWRQPGAVRSPDAGILVWDSPGTKVLHNTVILNGTFPQGAIDYRWSRGVVIANNLTDAPVWKRDDADGQEENNVITAGPDLFASAATGDWHLGPKAMVALRRVPVRPDCPLDLDGQRRGPTTDVGADDASGSRGATKPD